MDIREFAEKVQKNIIKKMGKEVNVKLQEVMKNNNVILQGLMILQPGQSVTPTIYLDVFFQMYEQGTTFQSIMDKIMNAYHSGIPKNNVDMNFFRDFNEVKPRIAYKLINAEQNQALLENIPHIIFLDLAICFYYAYSDMNLGNGTILIYNTHVKMWNTNTAELLELAQINTIHLFGVELKSMGEVIKELLGWEVESCSFLKELPMKVLSNKNRAFGAVCMIYPGLLEKIAESLHSNFYILPSSVHETIIIADSGSEDLLHLQTMVKEVNSTQVEPEELLSNNVYYYNRIIKKIKISS